MAYSAKTDFEKRFTTAKLVALTQGSGVTLLQANLDEAISVADALIDSYLMNVVDAGDLPLAVPPAFIKEYSVIIAVKHMQKTIQYKDIPEWVIKEYEAAINHLKDISKGLANIKVADTVTRVDDIQFDENAQSYFNRGSY